MRKEPNSSSEDISSNSENFLDNSPIDENSPSSGLADDHLRHTISELEIELDVAEEIKRRKLNPNWTCYKWRKLG